jgi:hypothetical protein
MKRLIIIILVSFFFLVACNRAPDNTENAVSSSGSYGGSGPADSLKKIGSGVNGKKINSPDSLDTITKGKPMPFPVTDSANKQKP